MSIITKTKQTYIHKKRFRKHTHPKQCQTTEQSNTFKNNSNTTTDNTNTNTPQTKQTHNKQTQINQNNKQHKRQCNANTRKTKPLHTNTQPQYQHKLM